MPRAARLLQRAGRRSAAPSGDCRMTTLTPEKREDAVEQAKRAGIAAMKAHWQEDGELPDFIKTPRAAYMHWHADEARMLSEAAARKGTDPIKEALRTIHTAGLLAPEQGSYHHLCIIAADGAFAMYDALLSALEATNKRADEAEALAESMSFTAAFIGANPPTDNLEYYKIWNECSEAIAT